MSLPNLQIITLTCLSILLITHDTVPLGPWNNLGRRSSAKKYDIGGTLVNAAVGLVPLFIAWAYRHSKSGAAGQPIIAVILTVVLFGAVYSWWLPWLFGTSKKHRRQLHEITHGTVTLLPSRHGVNPNALHCAIHLLTSAALAESLVKLWL